MPKAKSAKSIIPYALAILSFAPLTTLHASFLTDPRLADPNDHSVERTDNMLYRPTFDYSQSYRYSAWDQFYAPRGAANLPDLYSSRGGKQIVTEDGIKRVPVLLSEAIANGYVPDPSVNPATDYDPRYQDALAFWDARNPTLKQTNPGGFITSTNNIYSFSGKTKFVLENTEDYSSRPSGRLGTVFVQFETFGSMADFSSIYLSYFDGAETQKIYAGEAEYLREYTTGSGDWSGPGSYVSRIATQWDMSVLNDIYGAPISQYEIHFESLTSSMSLMAVDLITHEWYKSGMPLSAAWTGGSGTWGDSSKWSIYRNGEGDANAGIVTPQQNGNIRFNAETTSTVALTENFSIGELVFETAPDVTINAATGSEKLTSNTGVATRAEATGTYTVNADWEFGAINFFEIRGGTVVMNGVLSGTAGMTKQGDGTLVLANDNTFDGYLVMERGTLRLKGTNSYSGITVLNAGSIILEQGSAGLGTSTSAISLGADGPTYEHINPPKAEIWLDGGGVFSRQLNLSRGDIEKRIGAVNAPAGATISSTVDFTSTTMSSPHAGNVFFTAQNADDRLIFSGQLIDGDRSKNLTIDGQGTVEFVGVNKTYHSSTRVASGTLLIGSGTSVTGNGHWTVNAGGRLLINGTLGAGNGGTLTLNGTLGGNGTLQRSVTVAAGAKLAPGNSIGTLNTVAQTWGGGGIFELEVADFAGTQGTGWDLLQITGNLAITASESNQFVIDLVSLNLLGESGSALGFDPDVDDSWLFASFTGSLTGFNEDAFRIDDSRFVNFFDGTWGVSTSGNGLYLNYYAAPIPEPSTCLLGIAGAALLWRLRRKAA